MENEQQYGTLYVCATPIGNLEDITLRVLRVLKEADVIAAEDTRHTRQLLQHFDIHKPLISYYEHNKFSRENELIRQLEQGKTIALVSDAGTPGISDPGVELIAAAIRHDIPVVALPGASALLPALITSGLSTQQFVFIGFLPRHGKQRRQELAHLSTMDVTMVLYESPHRLKKTLADLQQQLGDVTMAVARELTKKYEQVLRGTVSEISAHFATHEPKGEFVLIVEGRQQDQNGEGSQPDALETVVSLMNQGKNKKEAIKLTASLLNIPKRDVYRLVLEQDGLSDED